MPRNILEALFDVRPRTKSGFLDLEKINKAKGELDLREKKMLKASVVSTAQRAFELVSSRDDLTREFEKTISEPVDITAELAKFGGQLHQIQRKERRALNIGEKNMRIPAVGIEPGLENFWNREEIKNEPETIATGPISHYHSPVERELELWLELFKKGKNLQSEKNTDLEKNRKKIKRSAGDSPQKKWLRKYHIVSVFIASGAILAAVLGYQGLSLKENIVKSGGDAVASLEAAKENLANFNFLNAADNFALAFDDFSKASDGLGGLGASFLSNFSGVPGLDKLGVANKLVRAGQYISKAGENMALAFNTLSQTNFLAGNAPLSKLINEFKQVLQYADKNVASAFELMADIESADLPEGKQQLFIDFKEKIPEFQKYIGEAIDYSEFLSAAVGEKSTKKYLLLLQNNSELRATGGFPGAYGILTFENGYLKGIVVDDVYNIDGQLKENIIPPIPLQHITPNWGMRDANWFADFPTSAQKVEGFYRKDGGDDVDGVLTLTPDVIGKIFDIVGPIEMPEYNLKLDSQNFVYEIQEEVEYGPNRVQPKTILKDLQPKFIARLAQQGNDKWMEIFKILTQSVAEKHILAYFNNPDLQKNALEYGIAGEVKKNEGDYIQIVFSNIKGSKTDAVIDNSFDLHTSIEDSRIDHRLTITRVHNGGSSKFGFYNKVNPAYIRVFAPKGSMIKSISGNSITDYRTLIGHEDFNFKVDSDLSAVEESITNPFKKVDVFEESGKTVFGFWLVTNPKQTKTITIEYESGAPFDPDNYFLLWQKQSGTGNDPISFSFSPPEGGKVINNENGLNIAQDKVTIKSDLSLDREIQLKTIQAQ